MEKYLCEKCEKNEAEYRLDLGYLTTINICEECSKEYDDGELIPLDELEIDEEERDGWGDITEHYN